MMKFDEADNGLNGAKLSIPHWDEFSEGVKSSNRKARQSHKGKGEGGKVQLYISDELTDEVLSVLSEPSVEYARWLRVLMLRLMTRTQALGHLKGRMGYHLSHTCEFLGLENFDKFTECRNLTEIRKDLEQILVGWEAEVGPVARFPKVLQANLNALADIVGLNSLEMDLLGLAVIVHAENALEGCCEILGGELVGFSIERILGPMLGHKQDAVVKCLQREQKLASSGLMSIDLSGRYGLRQLMDLLTPTFAARMLSPQTDIRHIVEAFVRPTPSSSLSEQAYEHNRTNLAVCKGLLKEATEQRMVGVNILIYGKPGTGKTEFARLLATELDLQLMEICSSTLSGAPVAPIRRVRNYRIAQAFFKQTPAAILFDECEEVLGSVSLSDRSDDEAIVPQKSWINQILESNIVPTIWIANSIRQFDEAYLRRFSVCFEMPLPTQDQREQMLAKTFDGVVGEQTQVSIARNKDISPAMLMQTVSVVRILAKDKTADERNQLSLHLINNMLKAQNKPGVASQNDLGIACCGFEPDWINSDVDLKALSESIQHTRSGRMCLWGPPGTGKTAFGKWLALRLGMTHLVVKASELLSPYLGETEQKMASAFEMARQQKAVLQFDEVDSFLQERQKASKQWEVTQVNEMLTQMEEFEGVFIASTNLFQNLDEASLRRFDMTIKFDFLKAEAAQSMFIKTCEFLGVTKQDQTAMAEVANMTQLTPGDFEQLIRRSRLLRPSSSAQLLQQLKSAVALKKSKATRPIGFLKAA
jgi:SpoVK/Ycf46/Vps4 family AAA+-type ATPase